MNALCSVVVLSTARMAMGQMGPCQSGQIFQCADGSTPTSSSPPCTSGGRPQCCTGDICSDAPSRGGGGGGTGGGGGGSDTTKACVNPTCSSPPCAAALRGDVGCSTVAGAETYSHGFVEKGGTVASSAHIYGPFEAGFGTQQKSIIEGWGCTDPTVAYDTAGGLDVEIAERKVAYKCGIQLPRTNGDTYIGLVGPCGGHTKDYHFHMRLSCLYAASGAHSTKVGISDQWGIYGKWEDFANNKLPLLDACGGHFGVTPDSGVQTVYHYHVQDKAPFIVGCHGPTAAGGLVSVSACRALYPKCSNVAEPIQVSATQTVSYIRDCPCFDANGNNAGTIVELPAITSSANNITAPEGTSSGGTAGDVKIQQAQGMEVKILGQSGKFSAYRSAQGQNDPSKVTIEMDALREVDASGNQVGKAGSTKHSIESFASQSFTFSSPVNANIGEVSALKMNFKSTVSTIGTIGVDTYIMTSNGIVGPEGEPWAVTAGDLKFNIELSKWTFCDTQTCTDGIGDAVEVDMKIKGSNAIAVSSPGSDQKFDLGSGIGLQLTNKVMVDGTQQEMPAGYPKVSLVGNSQVFKFRFPKFTSSALYDPLLTMPIEGVVASRAPGFTLSFVFVAVLSVFAVCL